MTVTMSVITAVPAQSPLQRIFATAAPRAASAAAAAIPPADVATSSLAGSLSGSSISSTSAPSSVAALPAPAAPSPPSPPAACSCCLCLLSLLAPGRAMSARLASHLAPHWRRQTEWRQWKRCSNLTESEQQRPLHCVADGQHGSHHYWRQPGCHRTAVTSASGASVSLSRCFSSSSPSQSFQSSAPASAFSVVERVSRLHGFLSHRSIPALMRQTNYSRHELFAIFLRFKSLCCLSATDGGGIDRTTFQRGVVRLSFEDSRFVSRVFSLVDTDNSDSIEWEEFLVAMAALEKGSAEIKAEFACNVYDLDGDGLIGRSDLTTMFQASSMLKQDGDEQDDDSSGLSDAVISMFVSKVFSTFGCEDSGLISFEVVLRHIKQSSDSNADVWDLFGRSMLKEHSMSRKAKPQPLSSSVQPAAG